MSQTKIQQIFSHGWNDYCKKYQPSSEQSKAAYCIMNCKSGAFGYSYHFMCGIHSSIYDACASKWFSKDSLL